MWPDAGVARLEISPSTQSLASPCSSRVFALRLSWDATRPYFWLILGGYLVIFAAFYVPYFGLIFVLEDLKVELGIFEVLLDTLYAVLSVLFTIFRFRVYDLLNERRDLGLRPEPYEDVG